MTEGKIVEWLKNPGDKVERGESVLVVESDKADMDVESFQDGYLAAVLMPAGSTAPVGETIGLIVENQEEMAEIQAQNKIIINPDESKAQDEKPQNSEINKIKVSENLEKTNKPLKPAKAEKEVPIHKKSETIAPLTNHSSRVVASPRARKIASQMGVDLSKLNGTGPNSRIQAEDVLLAKGQPTSIPWIGESD